MAEETISKQIEDESKPTQVAIAMQEVTTGIQLMMNALEARSANSEKRWSKTEGSVMIGITSSNKK